MDDGLGKGERDTLDGFGRWRRGVLAGAQGTGLAVLATLLSVGGTKTDSSPNPPPAPPMEIEMDESWAPHAFV